MASDEDDIPRLPPRGPPIIYGAIELPEKEKADIRRQRAAGDAADPGAVASGGGVRFQAGEGGRGEAEEESGEDDVKDEVKGGIQAGGEQEGEGVKGEGEEGKEEDDDDDAMEEDEDEDEGDEEAEAQQRMELSEASRKARERQEKVLADLEMKRRARALAVPTNDAEVRRRLRALGEPITLFGEREMERRERLRNLMARLDAAGQLDRLYAALDELEGAEGEAATAAPEEAAPGEAELFYTEGSNELLEARRSIANFSLPRAAARISRAKRLREDPDEDEIAESAAVLGAVTDRLSMECSEIGDERPLSGCAFSPDASLLATSGWSGNARLWAVPDVKSVALLRGHTERVTSVAFHPQACTPGLSRSAGNLATGSADRSAIIWALPENPAHSQGEVPDVQMEEEGARHVPQPAGKSVCTPLRKLTGHLDRLARIAFHPSGRFLGTASFDRTWRLWDVETGAELLLQEGHSRAVYGIGFQCDGSLVATGGLDSLARVWDLRTGRSVMALEGHVKPVLCAEFSPNGHHLATAGEDHSCRIWDLRRRSAKRTCVYTIPAHTGLVSQVRWEPSAGHFLVTSGYDNSVKIWSGVDFKPVRALAGHEGKVMGVDVVEEGRFVASVSFDRTIKLWAQRGF